MKIAGIDCGKQGAVVFLEIKDKVVISMDYYDTETVKIIKAGKTKKGNKKTKTEYDIFSLDGCLKRVKPDFVYLEQAQAMPGQGVTSMFSIGEGFGIWKGLLVANKIPYMIVSPRKWQGYFGLKGKLHDKKAAYNKAVSIYPFSATSLKTPRGRIIDGRVDALLIATYAASVKGLL